MDKKYVFAPHSITLELDEWVCYLFGGQPIGGICWSPNKGHVPNAFWRWMQWVCFGNRWVKTKVKK